MILYWLVPILSVRDSLAKMKNIVQSLMFIIINLIMNIFIVWIESSWVNIGNVYVIKDRYIFCLERCEKCSICKETADVFTELQDSWFFYPKQSLANNFDQVPYQPVLWRLFNSEIDKKNKKFRTEIEKSIPHTGLVLDYGKTRWSCIYSFFGQTILYW